MRFFHKKAGVIKNSNKMITKTTELASNINEILNDDVKKTLSKSDVLIGNANNLVLKIETFVGKLENCLPFVVILLFILAISRLGTMTGVIWLIVR